MTRTSSRSTLSSRAPTARAWMLPLIITLCVLGGSTEVSAWLPARPLEKTVCELALAAPSTPETYVDVKAGRLELGMHSVVITDDRCPGRFIFLEHLHGGPSLAFCEFNFGCPANTQDFRITADFIGLFYRPAKGAGRLRLKFIRNAVKTRL